MAAVTVDVTALLDTVIGLAREMANSYSTASTAKQKYTTEVFRLSDKRDFWQKQIATFGLQSHAGLVNALREAESLIKVAADELADPNTTSRCYCSWSKTKKAVLPPWAQLQEGILTLVNALDSITDDLKKQRQDLAELHKATLDRNPSLDFRSDSRYVRLEKTETAVIAELQEESTDGPLVVLLHGGPGKGKSSLARSLALQFEADAKKAATATAKPRSCNLESSSGVTTSVPPLSPLFERVIWLECGPQVNLEEAQLKLRGQLGSHASAVNEDPDDVHGSKDRVRTLIRSLLKNRTLLIVFDDVHDQQFLQAMLLLCGSRVKCLVTSQREDLRLNCTLAKVLMEDIEPEDARRIFASHIGLKDQSIPEATQGLADDIIHKIGGNPLAISCMAQAIDPRRATESREWEKASEDLSDWLDSSEVSQMHSTQYGGSFWGALQIAFERLTKQEKSLLVMVSMCEGPSVPEEVLEFLYERGKIPNSSNKFQASRRHLEMRQLIAIFINDDPQQRSWSIHSLLDRFINEKKKEEKAAVFNVFHGLPTSESGALSQEDVRIQDEDIVNALSGLYFSNEYAEKFVPKMFPSLGNSSGRNARRNTIEPITRLLVLKENIDLEWTPLLIDCVRQVFMKYIIEGVLQESGVLKLLMSPTSVISVLQVLDQITERRSNPYSSMVLTENIIGAFFKILRNLFEQKMEGVYTYLNWPLLISHIRKLLPRLLLQEDLQHNTSTLEGNNNLQNRFSLIFERNSRELEVVVSTFTSQDDQDDQDFQAAAATILGSIAATHPMTAFEMLNLPGLLHGFENVIRLITVDQEGSGRLEALYFLSALVEQLNGAYHDIRLSIGNSTFSSMLKMLVDISCDNKHPQLSAKGYALVAVTYLSLAAFRSKDADSIRIIKSAEGLVDGFINLLEPSDESPEFPFEDYVVGTLTLVAPEKSKVLSLNSASGFLLRGRALAILGRYDDSIKDLEKVGDYDLSYALGVRLFVKAKLGDLRGALADADLWINTYPEDPTSYQERGVLKRMMGNLDGAERDLNCSLKLLPDDYEVLKQRGYTKFLKNDEEGARADAECALSVKPSYVDRPGYKHAMHLGMSSVEFLGFQL